MKSVFNWRFEHLDNFGHIFQRFKSLYSAFTDLVLHGDGYFIFTESPMINNELFCFFEVFSV